jgi:NADH:ubiquinone oxidoreductase subunit B-like Fe-S oxidoreductase
VGDRVRRLRVDRRLLPELSRDAGADQVILVDVYIPGCLPRPEQVLDALIMLMDRIQSGRGCQLRTARELMAKPAQTKVR